MIKAELLEVDFEEDTMTFKCLDPIVAKKGNYVLIEESFYYFLFKEHKES